MMKRFNIDDGGGTGIQTKVEYDGTSVTITNYNDNFSESITLTTDTFCALAADVTYDYMNNNFELGKNDE